MAKEPRSDGLPSDVPATVKLLQSAGYFADLPLATAAYLALKLQRPLFLEGEAGVGKTFLAKSLAAALGRELIRLQCYEGLDLSSAAYEWNYARQILAIRTAEAEGIGDRETILHDVYGPDYLVERPLLKALRPWGSGYRGAPLLLIDELDRADEPFEAFLLEILSDFQLSIPELGTVSAAEPPVVVITSNRTREIHDALKRRCFYAWLDYPDVERESRIVAEQVPQASATLLGQVTATVARLREAELYKRPGIAETIDWARCLVALDADAVDQSALEQTLGVLLKYQDDLEWAASDEGRSFLAQSKRS